MMQVQDSNSPPPLPKRSNTLVRPALPSRDQHVPTLKIKSAIVVKKVFNEEFKLSCQTSPVLQQQPPLQPLFRHEVNNKLEAKSGNIINNLSLDYNTSNSNNNNRENNFIVNDLNKNQVSSEVKIWTNEAVQASSEKNSMTSHIWTLRSSENGVAGSKPGLFRCPSSRRGIRRLTIVLIIGAICFMLGVALPFMICKLGKSSEAMVSKFQAEGLRQRPVPLKANHALPELQSVLNNLYITVKTTHQFHYPRVVILLETWVSLVRSQTWFFSDTVDADMLDRTGGRIVNTNCSDTHSRTALACKMGSEFDHFLRSHKSWWCHFDDDNYVHVTRLAQLLQSHSPSKPLYLGKPSTAKPLEVFDLKAPQNVSHFWFATGGAGFCISRTLALKMAPYASDGKFVETGSHFWFPDDVTLGFIIEHILEEKLTVVPEFHSHLEPMRRLSMDELDKQISFSYISYNGVDNVLDLPGPFSKDVDPTRFYSLHCLLYNAAFCPDQKISNGE